MIVKVLSVSNSESVGKKLEDKVCLLDLGKRAHLKPVDADLAGSVLTTKIESQEKNEDVLTIVTKNTTYELQVLSE